MDEAWIAAILLILIPVAIFVFLAIMEQKKIEKAKREAEFEIERKKEAERLALEKKKEEERKQKIKDKEEIELLVEQYRNNPRTQKAAEDFAKIYISCLKNKVSRDIRKKNIFYAHDLYFQYSSEHYIAKINHSSGTLVDFEKENLQPIRVEVKMAALLKAIAQLSHNMIIENYKKYR